MKLCVLLMCVCSETGARAFGQIRAFEARRLWVARRELKRPAHGQSPAFVRYTLAYGRLRTRSLSSWIGKCVPVVATPGGDHTLRKARQTNCQVPAVAVTQRTSNDNKLETTTSRRLCQPLTSLRNAHCSLLNECANTARDDFAHIHHSRDVEQRRTTEASLNLAAGAIINAKQTRRRTRCHLWQRREEGRRAEVRGGEQRSFSEEGEKVRPEEKRHNDDRHSNWLLLRSRQTTSKRAKVSYAYAENALSEGVPDNNLATHFCLKGNAAAGRTHRHIGPRLAPPHEYT